MDQSESPIPNLTALPEDQVAKLLRHAGSEHLRVEAIRADLVAGAPVNPDGTLNLVPYGAWLVRELTPPIVS